MGFGPRTHHVQDAFGHSWSPQSDLLGNLWILLRPELCSPTRTWCPCVWILGQMVLCCWKFRRTFGMGNPRCRLDPTQERYVNVSFRLANISYRDVKGMIPFGFIHQHEQNASRAIKKKELCAAG